MGGRGGRLGAAGWHSGRGGGRESLPRHHGNRTALSKPQAVPVARCQGARVLQDSRNLLRPGTQQCAPSAAQPAPRRPRSPERPGHPHLALRASSRSRREPGGLGAPGRTCCPRRPHRQSRLLPGLSLWRPASLSVDPLISSHSCLHLYLVPPAQLPPGRPSRSCRPPSQAALNTQLRSTLPLPRCPLLRELNTFMIRATAPFSLYFSTRR